MKSSRGHAGRPSRQRAFASGDWRRDRVWVSYELQALAGPREVAAQAAGLACAAQAELSQGYGLVLITQAVLDRLGGGVRSTFGNTFWYLSSGVEALARRVSHAGPIAYLEAEMFGGTGTQATVVWLNGEVWLGPATTQFGWPPPDRASSPNWAFNQALRQLGVTRGAAFDEFEAAGLGRHRHTGDWHEHRA
jgi:hypothetical protein